MRAPIIWYTFLVTPVLVSCFSAPLALSEHQAELDPSVRVVVAAGRDAVATDALASQAESMWSQQQLVRSGELRIEVDSVPLAIDRVDSIAAAHGGLLADVAASQDDDGRRTARLAIRVPAERFVGAQSSLRELGEVTSEAIRTEDVTKAYADLETRIAVKEESVDRLRRLLAERTGALSDVLDVERELSRAVAELEGLKGERRYYDRRIAVSTIGVTLLEPGAGLQASTSVGEAFRTSVELLAISVSWLAYVVTFLLPWLVVAVLVWWGVRTAPRLLGRAR